MRPSKTKADIAERDALLKPSRLSKWLLAPPDALAPKARTGARNPAEAGRHYSAQQRASARAARSGATGTDLSGSGSSVFSGRLLNKNELGMIAFFAD